MNQEMNLHILQTIDVYLLVITHNFVLLQVNNTTYTYSPAQKVLEPNFVVGAPSSRLSEAGSQLNCVVLPGNLTTIGQHLFAYWSSSIVGLRPFVPPGPGILILVVFACPHLARLKYQTMLCLCQENLAKSCLIRAGLYRASMQIPGRFLYLWLNTADKYLSFPQMARQRVLWDKNL